MQHKRRYRNAVIFVWTIIFFIIFALCRLYAQRVQQIKRLLQDYALQNAVLPCNVTIIGYGSNTASAFLAFNTPEGRVTGSYERSWQGKELFMSAYFFKTDTGYIVFPYTLFSHGEQAGQGLVLFKYYTEHSSPSLYHFSDMNREQQQALKDLFHMIQYIPSIMRLFGDVQLKKAIVNKIEETAEYQLFISGKGAMYFIKNTQPIH